MKKKLLIRILIGVGLVCISTVNGVVIGSKVTIALNQVLSNNNGSKLSSLEQILKNNWYSEIYYGKEIDEDLLIHQFVGALSTSSDRMLDPYTYLTKLESTPIINNPSNGKLGITITNYYSYPIITNIESNGAAYGYLQEGDIVLSITNHKNNNDNKYSITDENMSFSTIFNNGLDEVGKQINVEVARFDENNKLNILNYDITLRQGNPTAYSYVVDENIDDTLMVKLTSFESGSNGTFDQLEKILKNNTDKNLIIDLRDNGGGALSSVVDICDLFLPENKLITTLQYKDNSTRQHKSKNSTMYEFDNIVILQNQNTASASEILISTLLYYYEDKVTLIGDRSYGKGIAQSQVSVLNNQYTLQFTCAKWLRPDNSWIGMKGSISPDLIIFKPEEENTIVRDELLTYMISNNANLYYKENVSSYNAFTLDNVSTINSYFFTIYNDLYASNIRTDGYYDQSCVDEILKYQTLKNIDATGIMNQETFLYFVNDYYCLSKEFDELHLSKAYSAIMG